METSAAALTTPTTTAPPAVNDDEPGKGAAEFLTLLTGETAAKPDKPGGKSATPIAKASDSDASTDADKTGKTGRLPRTSLTGGPLVTNLNAPDKASGKATDATGVVPTDTALPAALLAALAAGGAQGATIATTALNAETTETAETGTPTTPASKAKPTRAAAHAAAKLETGDTSAKAEAAAARTGDAKLEAVAAVTERGAKPQDHVASATAKAEEILSPAPSAAPAAADPLAPATAAGDARTSEVRIPLARETSAQTAIAAPILAMRVHTKDGATRAIEIRLDPVELGQVDVKLETGSDGKLKAVLSAENSESFELLKRESGALESALREAGVELGEDAITFTLNDQGPGSGGADAREAAYGGASVRRDAAAAEPLIAAAAQQTSWRTGALDISV
ncbi:hypothetical protein sos41_16270 [Alphaproteobacteria bacterium SO-S41]|nr:hypothetical protein sos41_16270 [Alphaproteobacteria bacterium SO-S41]